MNRIRIGLAVLAIACVAVGSRRWVIADDTSGSATCVGTSREVWDSIGQKWVPAWVGCQGGCNYAQGTCTIRSVSTSSTEEKKVCGCWDYANNSPIYDYLYVGVNKVAKCGPTETWDRTAHPPILASVNCEGPCNPAADCNRDYTINEPGVQREFKCQCGP